jgi:putative FmdB family regulatory protein
MPTYEYACLDCGTHVEVYQRFSDEPLTVCGVCGGVLRKVFHPAGILFKGSGFYMTDSRRAAATSRESGGEGKAASDRGEGKAASDRGDGGSKKEAAASDRGKGGSKKEAGASDRGKGAPKREAAGSSREPSEKGGGRGEGGGSSARKERSA